MVDFEVKDPEQMYLNGASDQEVYDYLLSVEDNEGVQAFLDSKYHSPSPRRVLSIACFRAHQGDKALSVEELVKKYGENWEEVRSKQHGRIPVK